MSQIKLLCSLACCFLLVMWMLKCLVLLLLKGIHHTEKSVVKSVVG